MKKKFTLLFVLALLMCASFVKAQTVYSTDFEAWTGNVPEGWGGSATSINVADSVKPYTATPYHGTTALQLLNEGTAHKRYASKSITLAGSKSYNISFWLKGAGSVRTGIYDSVSAGYTYGTYITSTATWTRYTQSVTTGGANKYQFLFSVKSTVAPEHIVVDSMSVTVGSSIPVVSIHDIQYTVDASGNSPYATQTVKTGGIVTAYRSATGSGQGAYWIQNGSGPWSGIYVYDFPHTPVVAVGDSLIFTAAVSEYMNLTELSGVTGFTKVSSGNTVPVAKSVTTGTYNTEQYESVLVKVSNANCTLAGTAATVTDGSGVCTLGTMLYTNTLVVGTHYDITGIVYYYQGAFKLYPRSAADITVSSGIANLDNLSEIKAFPNPANDVLNISNIVNCNRIEVLNIHGQKLQSLDVTGKNLMSINIENLNSGLYFVKIIDNKESVKTIKFFKQ